MKIEKFQRRTFPVDVVVVTAENMEEVAKWCGGTITSTDPKIAEQLNRPVQTWIQVEVQNAINDRQSKAFPGDRVLFTNRQFKVYTEKAFDRNFEPVPHAEKPAPKIHSDNGREVQLESVTIEGLTFDHNHKDGECPGDCPVAQAKQLVAETKKEASV